ncbi:hypothetical protein FKM82_008322 [Ascaphus truei]
MAAPGKQYGLIFPKKLLQKNAFLPKHSAFADDSDDESSVGESLQKEAVKKRVMKQTKLEIQKALEEDSTVYEYDKVYDDLQKKKEESNVKLLAGKDKKPKYIQSLLKAVEVRKKEQDRRMEKKIQKEREMEGEEFQDKEAFVTSAYKKKLLENADEEEREKREAAMEASLDVTKQKDLSGFYRHLLNQTVGEEETPECSLRDAGVKQEKPKGYSDEPNQESRTDEKTSPTANVKIEENLDADSDLGNESSEEGEEASDQKKASIGKKSSQGLDKEDVSKPSSRYRPSSSSSEEGDDHHDDNQKEPKMRHKGESNTGQVDKDKQKEGASDSRERKVEHEARHRHGEHSSKDLYRKREEQEDRPREKARREKESSNKDMKREKEYSDKDRARNGKEERHSEKERERSKKPREKDDEERKRDRTDKEKHREKEDKERGDRSDKDKKHRDREKKEKSPPLSEKPGKERPEEPSSKRKVEEGEKADETLEENSSLSTSKFAKRSNAETVGSARERYLARQMSRVSTKAYVEKEED